MNRILIPVVMFLALGLVSCKKDDYKNDGGAHDAHVNMTTYDYLKSKPQFSTLVKLIDRSGLKDEVNKARTFFAVTNYSSDDYVELRYLKRAVQLNDPNITYTMDSIPVQQVRDSLKMYIYADDLGRDKLTVEGKYYTPLMGNIPGSQFYVKLRRSMDYGDYLTYVDYVRLVRVVKTMDNLEADPDAIPNDEKDMEFDCQTSGIISTTGIIHVIANNHRMFFNREEKPQL